MQDDEDYIDGQLDDGDDSLDDLLQQWDQRPDKTVIPSWKAILKNTDICSRCGKKVLAKFSFFYCPFYISFDVKRFSFRFSQILK